MLFIWNILAREIRRIQRRGRKGQRWHRCVCTVGRAIGTENGRSCILHSDQAEATVIADVHELCKNAQLEQNLNFLSSRCGIY